MLSSVLKSDRAIAVNIHIIRVFIRTRQMLLTHKDIALNIVEVRKPELDAKLVADSIARQLEGRVSFRRAMKKSISSTMKMGAEGIKIQCGGRLGGAEIARTEDLENECRHADLPSCFVLKRR